MRTFRHLILLLVMGITVGAELPTDSNDRRTGELASQ